MIKRLAIEIRGNVFLPEADAYKEFFQSKGLDCDLVDVASNNLEVYDAVLLFHGFHPFWKKYPNFVIGEYHSLSTGRFARVKDFIKRVLNVRADVNIFLNETVRNKLWFKEGPNRLYRSMGVPIQEYDSLMGSEKKFDIVYAGSYRDGVINTIEKLSELDFSVAVVGFYYTPRRDNVHCFGRILPNEARKVIAQSRYGLNYTPDVYPFNIQDSTKVLEYCAAGLGIITNRYFWVDKFEVLNDANFLDIKKIHTKSYVHNYPFVTPGVINLDWSTVIGNSGIMNSIVMDADS